MAGRDGAGGPASLYEVLGVDASASTAELRSAYRKQALVTHPDKGGSEAAFLAVIGAFTTLSSAEKRAAHDVALQGASASKARRRAAAPEKGPAEEAGPSCARPSEATPATGDPRRRQRAVPTSERDKAIAKLCFVIDSLPREARKSALEAASERVREALLAYMVASGRVGRGHGAPTRLALCEAPEPERLAEARGASAPCTAKEPKKRGRPNRLGCEGVRRRKGKSYQALIYVCNLCVDTRPVGTLEEAIEYHGLLVSFQASLLDRVNKSRDFTRCVLEAMASASREYGIDIESLTPSYTIIMNAHRWIGRTKLRLRCGTDLRHALSVREQILAARKEGWQKLRGVWIDALQHEVNLRHNKSNRWRPKSEAEAVALVDNAFTTAQKYFTECPVFKQRTERFQMRKEAAFLKRVLQAQRREARRLDKLKRARLRDEANKINLLRAIQVAEHVLDKETRAKERAELQSRTKEHRAKWEAMEARWRWERDPNRTISEILQNRALP